MFEGWFETGGRSNQVAEPAPYSALNEVKAYWQALRDHHHVPLRADLDPRGIRGALSKSFVLDAADPAEPRFRIFGSDISKLHGRNLRGQPLTEMLASASRKICREILTDVICLPARSQLDFVTEQTNGQSLELRMVLLPMKDAQGQISKILGCLDFDHLDIGQSAISDLYLTGSILRPLGRELDSIERRMRLKGIHLISSTPAPQTSKYERRRKPTLTLVTP